MPSRSLEDLHPLLKPIAKKFIAQCRTQGIELLVICTYRTDAEQNALYAQGRTTPGKIVTNAPAGGKAPHNFSVNGIPASRAFDAVPVRLGKLVWNTKDPVWNVLGKMAVGLGLDWGGNWKSLKDYDHFELKLSQGS